MRFYATEQLGDKQSLTPEGFLLCLDVPVARTGTMEYDSSEIPAPIRAGADGRVIVHRDEDDVFAPEFLASFAGKPIVDDHPPEDVNPSNWGKYAVGTAMNPRRGSGSQADLILVDMIITKQEAIDAIRDGKREVSCGYDADYDEIKPGEARQRDMVGNHIALVEAGRCGSRCAIGDALITTGETQMRTLDHARAGNHKVAKWYDGVAARVRDAFKSKDEKALEDALSEEPPAEDALPGGVPGAGGDEHTHIHVHSGDEDPTMGRGLNGDGELPDNLSKDEETEGRLAALEKGHSEIKDAIGKIHDRLGIGGEGEDEELEGALEEEAPMGTGDRARKARDSVYVEDSFQATIAAGEILVPGIRLPTFDRSAAPKKTVNALHTFRKQALDLANNQPETRPLIEDICGGPMNLDRMGFKDVRMLFKAVSSARRATNSHRDNGHHRSVGGNGGGMGVTGQVQTIADLNKRNAEIYAGKK